MPTEELEKVTLNLRKGDWEALQEWCETRPTKPSIIVRKIVSRYVDSLGPKIAPEDLPKVPL